MARNVRTTITYDQNGDLSAIDHQLARVAQADFGDGLEDVEREVRDSMVLNLISSATITAAQALLDAFQVDAAAEPQRSAAASQAASRATCCANARGGTRRRAGRGFCGVAIGSRIGRMNGPVVPLAVRDWTIRSRLASM